MLFAGIISLIVAILLGWWGRPVNHVVSPRIKGWDFYFSSVMFALILGAFFGLTLGFANL
jgi:hypothetical protein